MSSPHDKSTTRIVAGESSKPKRRRTLEIGIAVGLVLLIGAGAAVASVVAKNNETHRGPFRRPGPVRRVPPSTAPHP